MHRHIITGNPSVSPGDLYIASEINVLLADGAYYRESVCRNLTSLTRPYNVQDCEKLGRMHAHKPPESSHILCAPVKEIASSFLSSGARELGQAS